MTDINHPITPPPELVQRWLTEPEYAGEMVSMTERRLQEIADKAARWGADMELEACCNAFEDIWDQEDVVTLTDFLRGIRAARPPKPPSLKEQALEALDEEQAELSIQNYKLIRTVLESIPDQTSDSD